MNICIVGAHLPPVMGGVEVHVLELAKQLAKGGDKVFLIGHEEPKSKLPKVQNFGNLEIIRVPTIFVPVLQQPLRAVNLIVTILKLHKKYRLDILHAHEVYPEGIVGAICSWMLSLPLLITEHGELITHGKSFLKRLFIKKAFSRAQAVIAPSEEMGNLCFENGADNKKINNYPNAVDTECFTPAVDVSNVRQQYNIPVDEFVILSLRRLDPKCGVQYLPGVASLVKRKVENFRFLMVGDGPLRESMRDEVERSGLSDKFIFVGSIENTEVCNYISASNLVVFPSLAEATSIAALEAMAMGKPVVASNVGGFGEIVTDKVEGLLVDFGLESSVFHDPGLPDYVIENFAEAVISLAKNTAKAQEMGMKAYERVVNNFSWDIYIEKIRKLYNLSCVA
jgi:glycosyltransferase involved in cell wall biosynthesis